MTKPLHCPACDAPLEDLGRVPVAIDDDLVRLAVDCSACAEHVEVVAEQPTAADPM
jgi:hypothetical protein